MNLFDKVMRFAPWRTDGVRHVFCAIGDGAGVVSQPEHELCRGDRAVQALALAHSTKEDYFERKQE